MPSLVALSCIASRSRIEVGHSGIMLAIAIICPAMTAAIGFLRGGWPLCDMRLRRTLVITGRFVVLVRQLAGLRRVRAAPRGRFNRSYAATFMLLRSCCYGRG
jgi:hypothetical protein